MVKPAALKPGDTIGVVAPSDAVDNDQTFKLSAKTVESWGLKLKYGRHIFSRVGDFSAGTATERIDDLRSMIFNPEIKAIWAAYGGYAATEVMPVLDRETVAYLKENPKWFIGYSDICLILNALTSFDMVSLMAPTFWDLSEWEKGSVELIRKTIMGEPVNGLDEKAKWKPVIPGSSTGMLVVSNSEVLVYSFGSRFDPLMYGRGDIILGFEELDVDKSLLARQVDTILGHKRANRIKGIVVGRLTDIKEKVYPEWGKKITAEELIMERMKRFGVPMAFCADFGHCESGYGPWYSVKKLLSNKKFTPLVNGVKVQLNVSEKDTKLEYLESVCGALKHVEAEIPPQAEQLS